METIKIESINELPEVAEAVVKNLGDHRVVALSGPMGAGKTTLISAILEYLGSHDTVTSPTFALVNQYSTGDGHRVYHFDFYRINRIEEAYDLGYEEYFYSGDLCLIEWPENVEALLPEDIMIVKIEVTGDHSRAFTIF